MNEIYPRFVLIQGATAVGKSSVALELALRHSGVLFNADSLQIYKNLNVGTAKPSRADQAKVPHFLYDCAEVGEEWNVADYLTAFAKAIRTFQGSSQPIFVVGGSGFYLQALMQGLLPAPPIAEEQRAALEQQAKVQGLNSLYSEIEERDPKAASKISPSDGYRVIRVLSYLKEEKGLWSDLNLLERPASLIPVDRRLALAITRPRPVLHRRIRLRVEEMMQSGLQQEVESLLEAGHQNWRALQSVGYKEMLEMLNNKASGELRLGPLSQQEAHQIIDKISMRTNQLAKRQETWLRRDRNNIWFQFEENLPELYATVDHFLKGK